MEKNQENKSASAEGQEKRKKLAKKEKKKN
jgi:hypothetical protein